MIRGSSRFMAKGLKNNINAKLSLLFWGSDSDRINETVKFSKKNRTKFEKSDMF